MWQPRSRRRSCRSSRRRQHAHGPDTEIKKHSGARVGRRACRQHVIHEHNGPIAKTVTPFVMQAPRHGRSERAGQVHTTIVRSEARLRASAAAARERPPHRKPQAARQVVRLIESAPEGANGVEGDRHHCVSVLKQHCAGLTHQPREHAGEAAPPLVLEGMDQFTDRTFE
jgi:hypothetical protein